MTKEQATELAEHWVTAWNAHDLDEIMSHYADDVVLTSPVVVERLGEATGTVRGRQALRAYFAIGLGAYPELRFELKDLMWGVNSVVLYYSNQKGTMTGEFMEVGPEGKVTRVVANYSGG